MTSVCETPNAESAKLLENRQRQQRTSFDDEGTDDKSEAEDSLDGTRGSVLGYISLVIGTLGVGFGLMFAQLLNRLVPHSELNALRYGLQFLLSIVIMVVSNNYDLWIERKNIGWAFLACTSLVASGYGTYGMSFYLPLGIATGIEGFSELVLFVLAGWALSRSGAVHVPDILATFVCLVGVVLISQPHIFFRKQGPSSLNTTSAYPSPCNTFVLNDSSSSYSTNLPTATELNHIMGGCFVALDVISTVTCALVIRYKLQKVEANSLFFWSGLLGVVVSPVLMGITETPTLPRLTICALYLAAHIVLSGSHNIFLVYGYQRVNPTLVGVIQSMNMILSFILQYTILSGMYPGHFNSIEITGAMLVFFANIIIPCYESIQYMRNKK